jgi:hypothetical protein
MTVQIGSYVMRSNVVGIVIDLIPARVVAGKLEAPQAYVMWQGQLDGEMEFYTNKYPVYVARLVLLCHKPARVIRVNGLDHIVTAKGRVFRKGCMELTLGHLFNDGKRFK